MSPAPLFTAAQLRRRVQELAAAIERDAPPETTIHLLGTLKGSFIFLADLVRAFSRPVTVDFACCDSYGGGTVSSGALTWRLRPRDVGNRYVVIVDDIVDSGATMQAMQAHLRRQQPLRLRTVCLLDKPSRRRVTVAVDYVGFTIDDVFVVGYGLDHGERYRHLPYIARLPAQPANRV